jgi:hypothetical protein
MKLKYFLSALFRLRNLVILILSLMIAGIIKGVFPNIGFLAYLISLIAYIVSLVQTLLDTKFHEEFNHKQKIKRIQDLNYSCRRFANEARKHVSSTYNHKLRKVLQDKDDIVNSFFRGERSFLKEKIVEQTLSLVVSYIRLLINYSIRNKELENMNVSDVVARINLNTRKLNFEKDPHRLDDLTKLIEMDQKIIDRMKEEKKNLEGISAKLDYMSSTVNMFKHQILSSIESEDMLEQLQSVVNEAAALDSVLDERHRSRINRIRF